MVCSMSREELIDTSFTEKDLKLTEIWPFENSNYLQHPKNNQDTDKDKIWTKVRHQLDKKNNTWDSNVVPHRSTNQARTCLTSLSRREAVLSCWYGRSYHINKHQTYINNPLQHSTFNNHHSLLFSCPLSFYSTNKHSVLFQQLQHQHHFLLSCLLLMFIATWHFLVLC